MAKKPKVESTALATWDEELAALAQEAADQEAGTGGGKFFSLRGGILSFDKNPVPNNEIPVVIVDSIIENVFYQSEFDPDNVSSPDCYAFGRDEKSMVPHEQAPAKQDEGSGCATCPQNQWGTANKGRGKACRNRRRLALIPAGSMEDGVFTAFENPDDFLKQPLAFLNLPPTAITAYGSYVKQLLGVLKRPPMGVFTLIKLEPDPKTQVKVSFETLGSAPPEIIQILKDRRDEARQSIDKPYQPIEAQEAPAPKLAAKRQAPPARQAPPPARTAPPPARAATRVAASTKSKY